jgi:hypothetical protein
LFASLWRGLCSCHTRKIVLVGVIRCRLCLNAQLFTLFFQQSNKLTKLLDLIRFLLLWSLSLPCYKFLQFQTLLSLFLQVNTSLSKYAVYDAIYIFKNFFRLFQAF